jgi:phosphoribosylanthranilate isomerase
MLIKVCGLTKQANLDRVLSCGVDMVGFNFYGLSERYLKGPSLKTPSYVLRVGVFVDGDVETILRLADAHRLDYVQLHGNQSAVFCREIMKYIKVIKVFRIDARFNWSMLEDFDFCDMFLFDTYTSQYGGSGKKFDWSTIETSGSNTPWLISGGIGPDDTDKILKVNAEGFLGVDINSRFELEPGIKDIDKIRGFCDTLKNNGHG